MRNAPAFSAWLQEHGTSAALILMLCYSVAALFFGLWKRAPRHPRPWLMPRHHVRPVEQDIAALRKAKGEPQQTPRQRDALKAALSRGKR